MKIQDLSAPTAKVEASERPSIWNREITFTSKKLSDKDRATFYHQLQTLVGSGVDIKSSLELVRDQFKKKAASQIVDQIIQELLSGNSLSGAFLASKQFSNYEYFSLKIGEESGRIIEVLNTLAAYYNQKMEQRRQIVNALSYPILIVTSSVAAIVFMMLFIIPMFEEVFQRFGSDLPGLTQTIIGFSSFITNNVWWLLLGLLLLVAAIALVRRSERWATVGEDVLIRMPYLGALYLDIQLSRCCASLALLTHAQVPLTRSIDFVGQMMTMKLLSDALERVGAAIIRGRQLHEAMSKERLFDKSFVSLVRVGEEVNRLGDFFDKMSKEYATSASYKTKQLNTFLEPVMIVFLGLMVGIILIAMYLPMFQLSTNLEIN